MEGTVMGEGEVREMWSERRKQRVRESGEGGGRGREERGGGERESRG